MIAAAVASDALNTAAVAAPIRTEMTTLSHQKKLLKESSCAN